MKYSVNWRRLALRLAVFSPLAFLWILSIQLGSTLFILGWIQLTVIAPNIPDEIPAHEHLLIVDNAALLMAVSLIVIQVGLLTFLYIVPKAEAWILKATKRKETTR